MAAVAARWVRGKRRPVWAVWHGPRLSGALRPGGEAASRPGRGGSAAEGGGGSWEIRDLRFLPVAGGYFWARVFFFFFLSFVPFPPSWRTPMFLCLQTTFYVPRVCSS